MTVALFCLMSAASAVAAQARPVKVKFGWSADEKKRMASIHYVRFLPENGDPTWMTVINYR